MEELSVKIEENPSASKPPGQQGPYPCWLGGLLALASRARPREPAQANPPASRDPSLYGRGPLCTGCRDQFP